MQEKQIQADTVSAAHLNAPPVMKENKTLTNREQIPHHDTYLQSSLIPDIPVFMFYGKKQITVGK